MALGEYRQRLWLAGGFSNHRTEIDRMGDIREFWIAVAMYVVSATTIYVILSMTPWLNPSPIVRVGTVLGGGIVLNAAIIFAWAGVVKLCNKR